MFYKLKIFGYFLFLISTFFYNTSTAQTTSGKALLQDGIKDFVPFGQDVSKIMVQEVKVNDQSFSTALLINTFSKPSKGVYGLRANINQTLYKGDVLWISFKARCLESKKETGEAFVEVRFDQLVDGKYKWPSFLERGISIGSKWTETSIPFILTKDVLPSDVRLVIQFDTYAQKLELGPISFKNYGQNTKLTDLPRSIVHYDGDAPKAEWRKAAEERIEKYRKGNITIKVFNQNGQPVKSASVLVIMKKIDFGFGTATDSRRILDTVDPNAKIYRDTLLKYFNKVVFENEMKSKNWERFNATQTIAAVNWLKLHNISVRGHVMVWPSWQHSPHLVKYKNDTLALKSAIAKQIIEQSTVMKGQFVEWDVINEPYAHHNIIDSLSGRDIMVDWFNLARKNTEGVQLYLNEYTMFHTGVASESFYNTIKFLKEKGAPIDGIGEQSHIGGTPPSINYILARLDHFATLGLPIQISEFDITSDDDDFKARYMNDFMTAIFSHPCVIGFMQWGFWAGAHWIPASALWDKDWKLRPQGKVFTDLISKKWNTNKTILTDNNGTCNIRGFNGDYEIEVKKGNHKESKIISLTSKGQNVVIKINN